MRKHSEKDSTNLGRGTLALERATEIVDNNAGAPRGKEGGISLSETTASAGHQDDLAIEPQLLRHCVCDVWGYNARNAKK